MNIILLEPHELCDGRGLLTGPRAAHVRTFLHGAIGSTFRVGLVNGPCGTATITDITETGDVAFEAACQSPTLAPWYDLILALPRPRSFKRILFQSAAMGVRNIYVVGAKKVEKSYFNMHLLREEEYRPVLIEGLMQAKTTALPTLHILPRLRDLWEHLPVEQTLRFIANPAPRGGVRPKGKGLPIIAIGPDGGWSEQENLAFADHGFTPITLGPRPLRTDTAAIALPAILQADYEIESLC